MYNSVQDSGIKKEYIRIWVGTLF